MMTCLKDDVLEEGFVDLSWWKVVVVVVVVKGGGGGGGGGR